LPFYRGFDTVGHILPFSNHWACDESGRHSPKPGVDAATDAKRARSCFLYHNTTLVQQPIDHSTLTAKLVKDAEEFITSSVAAGKPFLWYMPFPQCHVSMFTNTSFTNTSKNGIFGDQIREMDWAVGRVIETAASVGVANNTIFFFSTDHGPHVELCLEGGTAGHMRGGKGDSSWEGGLRVPGIVYVLRNIVASVGYHYFLLF
jgi:arylsulfatase A-like enzyme